MEKLSVCVVFGGVSSEHEISKISAAMIIDALDRDEYDVHKIYIDRSGRWMYFDKEASEIGEYATDEAHLYFDKAIVSPSREDGGILRFKDGVHAEAVRIDAVIPALHGKNGEDGTIQGLFELAGIPYVGSGVLGSAVCMDKCLAKIMFKEAGIPQARWVTLIKGDDVDAELIEKELGYPCFIKPSNAGSSVGVSKAHDRSELLDGIKLAFKHDSKVLIEEFISASEVESAVLGNLNPAVAENIGEIAPSNEFYDFDAKYVDSTSKLTIPAQTDKETTAQLKEYALRAYKICECRGLARVDFFVDKSSGSIWLNEINTLPGFTSISMYPKLWETSGLSNSELLDKLIDCALSSSRG